MTTVVLFWEMARETSDLPREELETLATRLRALIESAVDAIVTIDADGTIESANPATTRLFGYSQDELIGQNVRILVSDDHADKHDGYLRRYQDTGEARIIGSGREVEGRRRDGSHFPVHLSVAETALSDRMVYTGVLRDLSDWRESEAQATRLGRILEDSLNEIFVFDDESLVFKQVNRGARENLQYSAAELLRLTPVDLKPEFDEAHFRALLGPLVTGEKRKLEFETRHRRKDGSEYRVEVHIQYHREANEFVAVILDLSERDALQRQLIQAQRMEAVGRLAGGVAHDFNNLLTTIRGSSELIGSRLDESDVSQRALRRISLAAERGGSLTQQLLAFGGRQATRPEDLDLNSVATQIVELTQQLIADDVEVELDLDPQPLSVRADATLLDQVAMNLVVNAGDAMPDGGKLKVRTRRLEIEEPEAAELEMAPGPTAALIVEDTGIGMSAAVLAQIYEPFFTTKEVGKGTGLGLSTVHGIAKQCGWGLKVQSAPARGSSFSVLIPTSGSGREEQTREPTPSARRDRLEILLVEDDPMVRDLAEEVLLEAGHGVHVAKTPKEALEVAGARISEFDLLLSDVIMPGMTGLELARRLRGISPSLQVLLMSGYPEAALASRGAIDPEFPILRKPFSNRELQQHLDQLISPRTTNGGEQSGGPPETDA